MARMENRGIFQPLSPREEEALRLFHAGLSREEIATAMSITINKVYGYLGEACIKLRCPRETQKAAELAHHNGLI